MGLIQFIKNQNRIRQAEKIGKLDTKIQQYKAKPYKTDEDWQELSRLNGKRSKLAEINKIKSERNTSPKYTNTSVGFNFQGYQQVSANQSNKPTPKPSKNQKTGK